MFRAAVQQRLAVHQRGVETVQANRIGEDATATLDQRIEGSAWQRISAKAVFPYLNPNGGPCDVMIQGVTNLGDDQSIAVGVQEGFVNAQIMHRIVGVNQASNNGLFLPRCIDIDIGGTCPQSQPGEKQENPG